jgi:hypothetical protein
MGGERQSVLEFLLASPEVYQALCRRRRVWPQDWTTCWQLFERSVRCRSVDAMFEVKL